MKNEGKHCPSCGGIIGRDCFNPRECMEITVAQANQYEEGQLAPDLLAENQRLREKLNAKIDMDIADCWKLIGQGVALGKDSAQKEIEKLKEENEILREAFDAEKNEEELKYMAKLMDDVGKLREVVKLQTEYLKKYIRKDKSGVFNDFAVGCIETIKAGESVLQK